MKTLCDFPGCGWSYVGAEDVGAKALARHESRRHPIAAEAAFVAENPDGKEPRIVERETGCLCPVDVFDPDCPLHAWDAVW